MHRWTVKKNAAVSDFFVFHWKPARRFYERLGARAMEDWIIYRLTGAALENATGL